MFCFAGYLYAIPHLVFQIIILGWVLGLHGHDSGRIWSDSSGLGPCGVASFSRTWWCCAVLYGRSPCKQQGHDADTHKTCTCPLPPVAYRASSCGTAYQLGWRHTARASALLSACRLSPVACRLPAPCLPAFIPALLGAAGVGHKHVHIRFVVLYLDAPDLQPLHLAAYLDSSMNSGPAKRPLHPRSRGTSPPSKRSRPLQDKVGPPALHMASLARLT